MTTNRITFDVRRLVATPRWRGWSVLAAFAIAGIVVGALAGGAALLAGVLVAAQVARVSPALRQRRARIAHEAQRRALRGHREERLDAVCAPTLDLPELALLVDRCIPCGAGDPFDLDALLDRYAELALARHRCRRLLAKASRYDLESRLAIARVCHPMTAALIERRIAHVNEVGRLGQVLDDSLFAIGELIRYYAARATQADVELPPDDGLVAEVIERFDASTAAEAA